MKHVIRTTIIFVVLASLATMATADKTQKHRTKKAKPAQVLKLTPPSAAIGPMVGTWTLRNGDTPRKDIRMVFRRDGTFAFVGPNWKSTGTFAVGEHKLSLQWSSIDGSKVAPGTVKKDFSMAEDDSSFTIDKYTYYKLQS
jgi:hypothetical protein